jgi:hypothetical protein
MMAPKQSFSRRRRLLSAAIGAAALALGLVGTGSAAFGQDQSAATPKDAIFARKILMDMVGMNMDELETMTGSPKKIDLDQGHEHADIVSVLLQVFPHV